MLVLKIKKKSGTDIHENVGETKIHFSPIYDIINSQFFVLHHFHENQATIIGWQSGTQFCSQISFSFLYGKIGKLKKDILITNL